MNEWYHYLQIVTNAAEDLGYTRGQVLVFENDIYEAFLNDKAPEDIVGEIF